MYMATTVKLSWPKAAVLYIMPSHVPSVHSRAFTSIPLFQILIWFVQVWRGVKPWTIRTPGTQRGVAQSGLNISLIYWLPRECEAKRDVLPHHIHQPEGIVPCFASNSNTVSLEPRLSRVTTIQWKGKTDEGTTAADSAMLNARHPRGQTSSRHSYGCGRWLL